MFWCFMVCMVGLVVEYVVFLCMYFIGKDEECVDEFFCELFFWFDWNVGNIWGFEEGYL